MDKGNRKFVVALVALAATFVLGLVLTFVQPANELAAHITGMWSYTAGIAVGAFNIANAVEHYTNGKQEASNGANPVVAASLG